MLTYLLLGLGSVAVFAFIVIRNAEADDKKRLRDKTGRAPVRDN
jgi:hypothetical protein